MKKWQLLACLDGEDHLLEMANSFYDSDTELEPERVEELLQISSKRFYTTSEGYLRLKGDFNEHIIQSGISITGEYSILDAFRKFGGAGITEVLDY